MAESESEELDLASRELPVCFDADAGGGRFLATFTFLNRKDGDVKFHPFLMFKGSDSRKNLEIFENLRQQFFTVLPKSAPV